jgi:hypothetical protein
MKARQKEIKVLRKEAKVILFKLEMGKQEEKKIEKNSSKK